MMDLIVNEVFGSFQGEGVHTGIPTLFIRLAGCNLRCEWCDTAYALEASSGSRIELSSLLEQVKRSRIGNVCLTGGEPLVQEGSLEFVKILLSEGFQVDIETNGSIDIGPYVLLGEELLISLDIKLPSSGMEGEMLLRNIGLLRPSDQLKFVARDKRDLEHAFTIMKEHSPRCRIIFTPVNNTGGDVIADVLMKKLGSGEITGDIRLMVQSHKVIWGPDRKGV
ncbi:MAG: 7-carboxy-7-deazaguanine synthase QueE [Thermoplasmatota archaeon]